MVCISGMNRSVAAEASEDCSSFFGESESDDSTLKKDELRRSSGGAAPMGNAGLSIDECGGGSDVELLPLAEFTAAMRLRGRIFSELDRLSDRLPTLNESRDHSLDMTLSFAGDVLPSTDLWGLFDPFMLLGGLPPLNK